MIDREKFDHRPKVKNRVKLNALPENPEKGRGRFPSWLHRKLPQGGNLSFTEEAMREGALHTVCEEAKCPNRFECWSKKTATFLILGKECTRACGFCEIDFSKTPQPPDPDEPKKVAESVEKLGLKHVVITMVARDDLADGGALQLAQTVREVRAQNRGVTVEVLSSDFEGKSHAWDLVLEACPDVFNYNIETVRRLTPRVRHKATYERTLEFLRYIKKDGRVSLIKSGLMVGLGESIEEIHQTIDDLQKAGVLILTIGQYLQPSRHKLKVERFVTPEEFDLFADYARSVGVKHVYSGPFVRSSYNAASLFDKSRI